MTSRVDQHRRLLGRDLQPLEHRGALLVAVDVVPAHRQQVALDQVAHFEGAAGRPRRDQPHHPVPRLFVPGAAGQQGGEDVFAELGPAGDHVAQAGAVERDRLGWLDRDAGADRRLPGEGGDVADEGAAVGLGNVDVLARLAVDELDPAALDHEERRLADPVLVEHLARLEPAALAPLAQPLQLGVGEAREEDLIAEVRERLTAQHPVSLATWGGYSRTRGGFVRGSWTLTGVA
jgi:hypothetical protein